MRIVYNKILPIKGFTAINLFGIIFAREECRELEDFVINHEKIHSAQIIELLGIFFYVFYVLEWLVRLCMYRDFHKAYMNISFEREAYTNHRDFEYLNNRRRFSFINYINKK